MTWFRVEAGLGDHELVGLIMEGLSVNRREAVGLYVLSLAGFAEYQPDGVVKSVTTSTLEGWAEWRGKPGRYAAFFRGHCVETRQGQPDAPGVVKGWWRNKKLLEKQERDRHKRKKPPINPPETPADSWGNVDVDVDGDVKSSIGRSSRALIGSELTPAAYTIKCTAAANRGLRENPAINGRFNELASSAQDEPGLWQKAGIPIEVAESAIYQRAKEYRPKGSRIQPTTLGYFRNAVTEAWDREHGRAAEGAVNTSPPAAPAAEDEVDALARRTQALIDQRRERHRVGSS